MRRPWASGATRPSGPAPAAPRPGRWRAALRPRAWRHWTLRSRMVAAIATLAAVGLILANIAGVVLLRGYLVDRVDDQLSGYVSAPAGPGWSGGDGGGRPNNRGFGPDFARVRYTVDGTRLPDPWAGEGTRPDLGTFQELVSYAGLRPHTVDAAGGPWRVAVRKLPDDHGYEVIAVSLGEIEATANQLMGIDAAVTGLALLIIGLVAAYLVRIGLRPLTRMEHIASEIAGGDLSRRVDDADPHTESGRLGTALNAMLGHIEEALAARTASERRLRQFLADASHELRTPLTSIQGFAELYRRGGVPTGPELDEAMGRIESEVGRMRLLVNDLLLLARLDEERALERRPVDLLAVAADAVRDAHLRQPGRFVGLDTLDGDAEAFEPVTVLGDDGRIRQVVTNLIGNALQHTPDRTRIVVRVGRSVRSADPPPTVSVGPLPSPSEPVAVIEVADTGPGMEQADAQRAFERLYRAERSRARRHGGAGLGLSIVAAIVRAHGGSVHLWTAPGAGARFRVVLPAEPAPAVDDGWTADAVDVVQS